MSFGFPLLTSERIPIDTSSNGDLMANLVLIMEFIQRILQIWLDIPIDSIRIKRLSAAMTNTVYILSTSHCNLPQEEPRKLLLRVYGEGTDNILSRSDELDWFVKLSKARAGPRLLATFQNGRIEEYIESVTLTPKMMRNEEVSSGIAVALARFHGLEVNYFDGDAGQNVVLWERIENWRHEAGKAFKSLMKRFSANLAINEVLDRIKEFRIFNETEFQDKFTNFFEKLVNHKSPIVPCHNDLQHGNILLNDSNRIVFIDYEYGGMNFAAYDIANHFCEWASDFTEENPTPHIMNFTEKYPTIEERRRFISIYLGDSAGNVDGWIEAVEDFKEMSHLLWAYWGIIQANNSVIDFDYLGYSLMRLEAMTV